MPQENEPTFAEEDPMTCRISSWTGKLIIVIILLCGNVASSSEAGFLCDLHERTTSSRRGFGADCTAAQADLEADTRAEAEGICQSLGYDGICSGSTVTVTNACAWNENHMAYKVVGYRTFRCMLITDPEADPNQN
jgi:hypothetical protein